MATAKVQVEIGAKITELQKKLDEAKQRIKQFSSEAGDGFKRLGEGIKSVAVPAGIASAAITAVGLAAVKSYGRLQSLEKGLAAVAGSTDAAKRQLEDLREVAKLPGLGLEEAVRGSINLQAIGISAERAQEAILQFGNAVATVGKGRAELDRALYGLQQLANTDFPLGEDLNIIKDAIPQVSKLLTEAFGANRSDELAKMGVTSQQLVDVILEGLADLPRVAGGVENAIENMQDGITEAWQEMGKAINDALDVEGIMNKVGDALGGVVEWFRDLSPAARNAIVYIGAGTAAFTGLLAALGAVVAIAPAVTAAVFSMTGGIAAITTAVALAAVYIIDNWKLISITIQQHAARMLVNLYQLAKGLAGVAEMIGATTLYVKLKQAGLALSATFRDLNTNISKTRKELEENGKESGTAIEATTELGNVHQNTSVSIGKTTEAVNRLSGELIYLNGIIALNGKEFKRNPITPTIGTIDRGATIDIGLPSIDGVLTEAAILAQEVADAFNESAGHALQAGIADTFGNIGNAIGDAIASGANAIDAAGKGLLSSLGNVLVELGEIAIQTGIGIAAIKTALKSLNPFVAIAAGTALVVLGRSISKSVSDLGGTASIAGQGSSGSSVTSGTVVNDIPNSRQNRSEVVFRISGRELKGVLANANNIDGRY